MIGNPTRHRLLLSVQNPKLSLNSANPVNRENFRSKRTQYLVLEPNNARDSCFSVSHPSAVYKHPVSIGTDYLQLDGFSV